jgi:hypothetical protein
MMITPMVQCAPAGHGSLRLAPCNLAAAWQIAIDADQIGSVAALDSTADRALNFAAVAARVCKDRR